jgi:hypothetical protein
MTVLGIGWDVGGWMGHGQAVAAVEWGDVSPRWLGSPASFSMAELKEKWGIHDLVSRAWSEAPSDLLSHREVVLAIDAPLGFPIAFVDLLARKPIALVSPKKEIDNPLAYRETDRHIHSKFGKKPLSATFDRIGNTATVAMVHTRRLSEMQQLRVPPFEERAKGIATAIEVYPALLKENRPRGASKLNPATRRKEPVRILENVRHLMPNQIKDGTHQSDACLCALLALAYGYDGRIKSLPRLQGPTTASSAVQYEGWIFYQDPHSDWMMNRNERLPARLRQSS